MKELYQNLFMNSWRKSTTKEKVVVPFLYLFAVFVMLAIPVFAIFTLFM